MNNPAMTDFDRTKDFNIRYIGASPNNYIDIGDRDSANSPILWRIIGIMNNMTVVDDGNTTHQESLIKIIRADSIGNWSWDSSAPGVNNGWGVNEWSGAVIMTTLNSGAYWSKKSGQCYDGSNDSQSPCDFSNTGLTSSVKDKLVKVRWNTGAVNGSSGAKASYMYEEERSNHNGKELCANSEGNVCNDPVERKTTWDGYIGLMYPSDYGYAVGGSERAECLSKSMSLWNESSPKCKNNDWLNDSSSTQWTITPQLSLNNGTYVFDIHSSGSVYGSIVFSTNAIRPVAYLKSSVKIKANSTSDYGSQSNPFVIEGVS